MEVLRRVQFFEINFEIFVDDQMADPMDLDADGPRGVKRKADDEELLITAPKRIIVSLCPLSFDILTDHS